MATSTTSTLRHRAPSPEENARAFDVAALQQQVAPIFVKVADALEVVSPLLTQVYDAGIKVWEFFEPYHPEDLAQVVYGFFLVFFGGVFMTLVASVEAAYQFGWVKIKTAVLALYREAQKARIAYERDNQVMSATFTLTSQKTPVSLLGC